MAQVSPKIYLGVFAALIVGTLATTGIAYIDLGPFNPVAAFLIAGIKATLVILFFMHVRYEKPITTVFAIAGFCWLAIMLGLSYADYGTRGSVPEPGELAPKYFEK
jgi:cytochrome c oxidase subunit 4